VIPGFRFTAQNTCDFPQPLGDWKIARVFSPTVPFVRINRYTHYLWRAVDHEGEVLEVFATKRRDRKAAVDFLKRAMKRY